MKITYDPYADAMYLSFNNKPVVDTDMYRNDVIFDYGANKIPTGMEILSISKKVSKKQLGSLRFELNTEEPQELLPN